MLYYLFRSHKTSIGVWVNHLKCDAIILIYQVYGMTDKIGDVGMIELKPLSPSSAPDVAPHTTQVGINTWTKRKEGSIFFLTIG